MIEVRAFSHRPLDQAQASRTVFFHGAVAIIYCVVLFFLLLFLQDSKANGNSVYFWAAGFTYLSGRALLLVFNYSAISVFPLSLAQRNHLMDMAELLPSVFKCVEAWAREGLVLRKRDMEAVVRHFDECFAAEKLRNPDLVHVMDNLEQAVRSQRGDSLTARLLQWFKK